MAGTIKKLQFASGVDITEPTDLEVGAASSGSGGINVITDPNDADAGWAASGAGITVATSSTSSDLPLAGVIDTSIKITPVSSTAYAYIRFTMPVAMMQSLQSISWAQRPLSGYAAGDLKLDMYVNSASNYSGSYTRVTLSTDSAAVTSIPAHTGTFQTSFVADSNAYYEMRITRVAGTTALNITNVFVGLPQKLTAPAKSTPVSWTPTFTGLGTVTNISAFWWIDGNKLYARGTFKTGTPTGVLAKMSLPSGHTIDTAYNTMSQNRLGIAIGNGASAADIFQSGIGLAMIYDSTDATAIYFAYQTDTTGNDKAITAQNGNIVFNANARVVFDFSVDIAQLGGATVNMGANQVDYASVAGTWDAASSTTVSGLTGTLMGGALTAAREKTITWSTPMQASERIQIWASKDQVSWFPINGAQLGAGNNPVIPSVNAAGTVVAGVAWRPGATAYETIVTFGQYMSVANDDAPAVDWPSSAAYWVATKSKSGSAVAFGIASPTMPGLAPAGTFGVEPGVVDLQEITSTPSDPTASNEAKVYLKADKLILAFNDAGTVRYKYLDLTGTGVTWVHTTSAP